MGETATLSANLPARVTERLPAEAAEDGLFRTDEDLLRLVAAGESEALAQLYDRYARSAFGLALRLTGSPDRAEEVVQEAFWRIWRGARSFDPSRSKPGTWLLSIVHHQAVDLIRRQRRRPDETHDLSLAGEVMDREPDPAESVWRREQRRMIVAALADLPPLQREAIELAYFGGLSQSAIAERQGAPISTVKTRLQLGLKKLNEALRAHRGDLAGARDDG